MTTPQTDAFQQVFTPSTQRMLLRIGLVLGVIVLLILIAGFAKRFLSKKKEEEPSTGSTPFGGFDPTGTVTPGTNIQMLADRLKKATGWVFLCSSDRCQTILALEALPNDQLIVFAKYYKSVYGQTISEVFDGFTLSGCCFEGDERVTDAKLESIQKRVRDMNI